MSLLVAGPLTANDVAMRATARAHGTDRATAITVGRALLAHPLPAQLTQIRCESVAAHHVCGLVVSGVKFKYRLDRRAFLAEVRGLIAGAFASAPLEEVDLWTTVPLDAAQRAATNSDFAVATAATVFSVTVPRSTLGTLDKRLASGRDVFWDAAFADSLGEGHTR